MSLATPLGVGTCEMFPIHIGMEALAFIMQVLFRQPHIPSVLGEGSLSYREHTNSRHSCYLALSTFSSMISEPLCFCVFTLISLSLWCLHDFLSNLDEDKLFVELLIFQFIVYLIKSRYVASKL